MFMKERRQGRPAGNTDRPAANPDREGIRNMEKLNLCGIWTMTGEDGRSFPSEVPGSVLKTLLDRGAIPDPFDGLNEFAACEETRQRWCFERTFRVPEAAAETAEADLVFDGLDTLATVELNGQAAARTDNMHRTWRIPVGKLLRAGENRIRVSFDPAMDYVEKAAEENPEVTYPGGSSLKGTGFLRKAHYMFGWDWGPRLPDAGIWREARIEFYDSRLEDIRVHQKHETGRVKLEVLVQTGAEEAFLELTDPEGSVIAGTQTAPGEPAVLTVEQPELWWPNGLGGQPLYTLKVTAMTGGRAEDERILRLGLRTMTVLRTPDEWGESFAMCCNGVPFFAMGGDYIPEDNLLTRMNREKTRKLLQDCRDCCFNSIRVWGGGVYPDDNFFDLCDEMGLVVWQDMMFACNTYKLSDAFRESVVREAEDNLRRIRHHASLGLISGNNEMETAWLNWGEVKDQPEYLKQEYLELFEHLLKETCEREAPDIFYWPSSPSSGGGFDDPDSLDRGDVHDWSVWPGRKPFSDFAERFPRFCSEFGFESFPCMDTLRSFVHDERDMNPFSRVMESHQKCLSGNATMLFYLSQTLRYPFSMEKLVHASQWLQAEAMRAGVEHWRRNRGRCMGAIFWQINDCWPVASWAAIDSAGRWKALQYRARRFFAPTAVTLRREGDGYTVHVSHERREPFRGTAVCTVRDEAGRITREFSLAVDCPAMSSAAVGKVLPEDGETLKIVQCVLLDESGKAVSECEELYTLPKYFPFEKPEIRVSCEGRTITLEADKFCTGVELQAGEARFSDNWVTLYPGETRKLTADRELEAKEISLLWLE